MSPLSVAGRFTERESDLNFRKKGDRDGLPPFDSSYRMELSTETELLDDLSVSLDVNLLEVVQNLTSLTYEAEK